VASHVRIRARTSGYSDPVQVKIVTERIKDALEKARERRQSEGGPVDEPQIKTQSSMRAGSARILGREPFRHYSNPDQQRILDASEVIHINGGDTLQIEDEKDAYVHYLLSGVVSLESGERSETVSADGDTACSPLDDTGEKPRSITATCDVEVLRVPREVIPVTSDPVTAAVPKSDYTETFSGRQLADLVDQISTEQSALDDSSGAPAGAADELAVEPMEATFSGLAAAADDLMFDFEFGGGRSVLDGEEGGYVPKFDDEIGRLARELEARFSRYVDQIRADERARYDRLVQQHTKRLQKVAQHQINKKLAAIRERYQNAHVEHERRLRERYRTLRDFANKMAAQKAAIYAARRQISEKLQTFERIQGELSRLGSQLDNQLGDLDELMPDIAAEKSASDT